MSAKWVSVVVLFAALVPRAGEASTFAFFGPEDFTRQRGQPAPETRSFTVPNPGSGFTLRIENGGRDRQYRLVSSAVVRLNGIVVVGPSDFNQTVALIEREVALAADNELVVELRSVPGSGFTLTVLGDPPVTDPPAIAITAPVPGLVTASSEVEVSGTLEGTVDTVTVNGITASFDLASFSARVPLVEGTNLLVATAANAAGESASDSISVRRDATPPLVVVETPRAGDRLVSEVVTVAGTVNDIIPGATVNEDDVRVTVNGLVAAVNNRTFFLPDLPLVPGTNAITATAVDRAGNVGSTTIEVIHTPDLAGIRMLVVDGNNQLGTIRSPLPVPLRVRLVDHKGSRLSNRPVTFSVSRGDGLVGDPDAKEREATLLTDAGGEAAVSFSLGTRTGEGFHRVRADTPGSAVFAEFCATALPTDPLRISITRAPRIRGVAGQKLGDPLSVIVTDDGGNPVPGVPVTFRVDFGGGSFAGERSIVVTTNADGIAEAQWTLGADHGVANHQASATFAGNPGFPAFFVASAVLTGPVAETRVSGIVQNSLGGPIVGARVAVLGTGLETVTAADGGFTIPRVPPGGHRVSIHGSAANDPAAGIAFPDIDYEVEVIAGVDNALDQVVVLPFLDMANAKLVGGDEDVVLGMEGVDGFAIKVFGRSVILPDGTRGEVLMSSSQVKFDKVPMPPPQGGTSLVVGTLQPAGIRFDPPAQVIYPNVAALAPGDVGDIFAFHHDIGQFVNIGPGTVSEDGDVIVSDPGFGIVQSGWHCIIRLPGGAGQCANGCAATGSADGVPITETLGLGVDHSKVIEVTFNPLGTLEGSWRSNEPTIVGVLPQAILETVATGLGSGMTSVLSPINRIGDFNSSTCQVEIDIAVLQIVQDDELWYFGGEDPPGFIDGSIEVTLTAIGATVGRFRWHVIRGSDKVEFENGADEIVKANSNSVDLRSTAASAQMKDVVVQLFYNDTFVAEHPLEVRAPTRLRSTANFDFRRGADCDTLGDSGYASFIGYEILSQFDELVRGAGINELFGTETDIEPNNWPIPEDTSFPASDGTFSDFMCVSGAGFEPAPLPPQSPLTSRIIDIIEQDWFAGSTETGKGILIQRNDFTSFIDHGRHLAIITPAE